MSLTADYTGASVLTCFNGRLLWVISGRSRTIHDRLYLTYGAVGGSVERGESYGEAAVREFMEETSCSVEIVQSPKTFIIDDVERTIRPSPLRRDHPLIVYRKRVRGRKTLLVHAFLGKVTGVPEPSHEVQALLYAPAWEMFRRSPVSLGQMISEGSAIVERGTIPRAALMRPWGTPVYLRKLLQLELVDLSLVPRSMTK